MFIGIMTDWTNAAEIKSMKKLDTIWWGLFFNQKCSRYTSRLCIEQKKGRAHCKRKRGSLFSRFSSFDYLIQQFSEKKKVYIRRWSNTCSSFHRFPSITRIFLQNLECVVSSDSNRKRIIPPINRTLIWMKRAKNLPFRCSTSSLCFVQAFTHPVALI